jgi:hypothetical protein
LNMLLSAALPVNKIDGGEEGSLASGSRHSGKLHICAPVNGGEEGS